VYNFGAKCIVLVPISVPSVYNFGLQKGYVRMCQVFDFGANFGAKCILLDYKEDTVRFSAKMSNCVGCSYLSGVLYEKDKMSSLSHRKPHNMYLDVRVECINVNFRAFL
jgi:hypothetical protein